MNASENNSDQKRAECGHSLSREACKYDNKQIYKCDSCGLFFSQGLNDSSKPDLLYSEYYKGESSKRFGFGIEFLIKAFRFIRALKIAISYPSAKSILDIGSGRGYTLYYLKKYFKFRDALGIQISKNACKFSREKLGLRIIEKDFLDIHFGEEKFDIVTMTHVLEHVSDPEKYIKKISDSLNYHGKLVIEVPNFESWTSVLTKGYWLGLDMDYHLSFFTSGQLFSLLRKHCFKIKTTRYFSLEYSTFISAQSLSSMLIKSGHTFFSYLQGSDFSLLMLAEAVFFLILFPFCFLINLFFYFSRRGEVIFIVAEKG